MAVVVGLAVALCVALEQPRTSLARAAAEAGWVYFLSPIGGEVQDPPAPIKIGSTHRDPYEERLPEIETMSPQPLQVLDTIYTNNPEALEARIHRELARFRRHGEWFDRDVTLAFLDNLRDVSN